MTARILVGLLFLSFLSLARAAEIEFSKSLSAEDYQAAGLDRLSPEERARLDALVAKFRQSETVAAREAAETARVAREKAEAAMLAQREAEAVAKAAKEEAQRAKAEAKAAAVESKASEKGFFAKAKVLLVPGTQIEYAEISSTIEGTFEGWSGRTVFRLANGQRWQVANGDERYFVPPEKNVVVQIRTAALGGFWMYFPSLDKRVRVKLLGEK